jgi:glucose-1-phosphate cytidylyltransferase
LGTRISEETEHKPKPMVLIDDKPIIWHIMKIYASQGFNDFIIATGYKGEVIREWLDELDTNWTIFALDTGLKTQTASRILQSMKLVPGERVFVTYGDGVANVNLNELLNFHQHHGRKATVTAVRPPARFGVLESENGIVSSFGEKRQSDAGWINGGFFVLEPNVIEYFENQTEPFEFVVLPRLVEEGQLSAFHHHGFWQPMDTLREKNELSELARLREIPWFEV